MPDRCALTAVMFASRKDSEGRVPLSPGIPNSILPLDDHTGYVHLFEPSGYLKAGLRCADCDEDFRQLLWKAVMSYRDTHR